MSSEFLTSFISLCNVSFDHNFQIHNVWHISGSQKITRGSYDDFHGSMFQSKRFVKYNSDIFLRIPTERSFLQWFVQWDQIYMLGTIRMVFKKQTVNNLNPFDRLVDSKNWKKNENCDSDCFLHIVSFVCESLIKTRYKYFFGGKHCFGLFIV